MPITVQCEGCGKQYRVSDQAAGKRLRCRECGRDMLVPMPGAASEEADPFEALVAMERGVAPPSQQKRAPLISQRPMGTIDVKADAPSARFREPPRYGRSKAAAVGTDNLSPWAVILFVVLQITLAIVATVRAHRSGATKVDHGDALIWTQAIVSIASLFLLLGPLVFLGVFITSKIFRFRVVDLGWLRGCGVAAIPMLVIIAAAFLSAWAGIEIGSGFWTLVWLVTVVLCFFAIKYVFDLDWIGALVSYVFSGPLYFGGLVLATVVVMSAIVAQIFAGGPGPVRHFSLGDQYFQGPSAPANPLPSKRTEPNPVPPRADADVAEKATRTEDNLRQIGQAAQKFAATTDKNFFPPSLDVLATAGGLPAHCLNSPFQSPSPGGYTYWPDRSPAMPADVGIAYDAAELAATGGTHVLFANGTVEKRTSDQIASLESHSKQPALDWQADQEFKEKQRQEAMAREKAAPPPAPNEPPPPKPQDFVSIFNAQKAPYVASVSPVFLLGQVRSIVSPMTPSSFAAVVRDAGNLDAVDLWDLNAGQNKAEASFARDAGADTSYALSPDGAYLARLVRFPKLGIRIWSARDSRETRSLLLNEALGTPTLYGFLNPEKLGVIWTKSLEGMEIWDVTTGRVARQTPFQAYDRTVNNGVLNPDGREYAFTSAKVFRGTPQVALFNLYAPVNSKWRFHEILDVNTADVNSPAGLAFSPDGKKLAALFARQGAGFVICWRVADVKPVGEYEIAVPAAGGAQERGLEWVHNGSAWLIMGNTLVDAGDGKVLGQLNAPPTIRQWTIGPDAVALMYSEEAKTGLAVAKLDPARFGGSGPATKAADERKR
jgi:ribosomal protein S27E